MESNPYYSQGGISNSSLKHINPLEGGSPKRFKAFVLDHLGSQEETPSLKNGKLVHKYVECPEEFIVADIDQPSEMMCAWVERVLEQLPSGFLINKEVRENGSFSLYLQKEKAPLYNLVVIACKEGAYSNLKNESKILEKFNNEGLGYLKFLIESTGKLCLTPSQKVVVENTVNSLREHARANELLFSAQEPHIQVYNELPIYWECPIPVDGEFAIMNCKSLIDRLILDPVSKTFILVDLKTTGKPISKFHEVIKERRYHRQMGFYLLAIRWWLEQEYPGVEWQPYVKIVAVETNSVYETKVFDIPGAILLAGVKESHDLLRLIHIHTVENQWIYTGLELADGEFGETLETRFSDNEIDFILNG
jgi:hypothetical protein